MKKIIHTTIFNLFLFSQTFTLAQAADVIINGQILNKNEIIQLEKVLGSRVIPGNYLSDGNCWVNLHSGANGCINNANNSAAYNNDSDTGIHSRYGSGERNSDGQWSHWSDAAGGSVGADSDGCVYTSFGWSSC